MLNLPPLHVFHNFGPPQCHCCQRMDCISMANYINDLGKEIKNCKAGIGLSEILDGESVHNIPESLLFINIMLTILCALLTMSKI